MMSTAVPKEAVTIYNNALTLSNQGDYSSALNEYMRAIEKFPSFIEAYNNIGEIYSRIGNSDLAISTYKKALNINRDHKVLLNIGVEYYNAKNYPASMQYFSESLAIKADFLEGNFYMGLAYFNMKDNQRAEIFFKNVIAIDRRHIKANYLLAYIYYDWKDYAKTLACLDNIKDIADDKVFINKYYGFCYYNLGRYEEAVSYLTTAMESDPAYAKFRNYLKSLTYESKLKEIGDVDKKIREMEDRMMREKPSLKEFTHLSMLYIFKGEYKKAEKLILSAKKGM